MTQFVFSKQNFSSQKGVGLLEVMVSLMLLGIAVLGFIAMQVKANNVSNEASNNTHAVEIAKDLHERMRINRNTLSDTFYRGNNVIGIDLLNGNRYTAPTDCAGNDCNATQLAEYDFAQAAANADEFGMNIAVRQCPLNGSAEERHCIYVAWGNTTPTIGNNPTDCTDNTNTYQPNAQCIFMESFSYVK